MIVTQISLAQSEDELQADWHALHSTTWSSSSTRRLNLLSANATALDLRQKQVADREPLANVIAMHSQSSGFASAESALRLGLQVAAVVALPERLRGSAANACHWMIPVQGFHPVDRPCHQVPRFSQSAHQSLPASDISVSRGNALTGPSGKCYRWAAAYAADCCRNVASSAWPLDWRDTNRRVGGPNHG